MWYESERSLDVGMNESRGKLKLENYSTGVQRNYTAWFQSESHTHAGRTALVNVTRMPYHEGPYHQLRKMLSKIISNFTWFN